jgi:(5-formylfuran-3-yl)methyl phosphate synthase
MPLAITANQRRPLQKHDGVLMLHRLSLHSPPGLLISVRNAAEAAVALAGGADVIDVKEPSRGSLGAADAAIVASVVEAVGGRVPVSAALGELDSFSTSDRASWNDPFPPGVALVKLGLAGCGARADWAARWRAALARRAASAQPVGVVYADWRVAAAPVPERVLSAALECRCPALLVDTWDKTSGTLLDHWPADSLARFMARVRQQGLAVVLAGSLAGPALVTAIRLAPDLVALRGAVCRGGREGTICIQRVREVRRVLAGAGNSTSLSHR